MSRYVTVLTQFTDGQALVLALIETGKWAESQIEIHHDPQHLLGYKGDRRAEKAHIIIRRKHVGCNSNDIGFVKGENGEYTAIVSEYDSSRYGRPWIGQLKSNYVFHKIRKEQEAHGRSVERTRCSRTGKQQIEISGYK